MHKYDVEVGVITQLPASDFAIAHHRKTSAIAMFKMGRLTVFTAHLQPCLAHNRLNNRFGKIG
ncbi:Uncharacterised protein [Vibrio cholerae]|uniref:Uncharacterized protein n=1 Tax=Vibrio cholerae TaxID=666 RepID=A0A655TMX4_VIBCL|nr:Uncharacterised protein [Vibrio cholerae]CSD07525.1 Uncharacterised protein [Vibrio cholerae]CSI89286.1 Uncharacterised protein [Vibrio cholerae]